MGVGLTEFGTASATEDKLASMVAKDMKILYKQMHQLIQALDRYTW